MWTIVLAATVGVAYIIYRYREVKQLENKINELSIGRDFQLYDYSKLVFVLVLIAILVPLSGLIYYIKTNDINMIAFTLAFCLIFSGEAINAKGSQKFYYNKSCCVIDKKVLNYKSIKSLHRKTNGRYLIVTYNGEQLTILKPCIEKIIENSNLKLS